MEGSQRGVETTLKLRVPGSVQVTEISMAPRPSLSSGSMLSETVAPVTLVLGFADPYIDLILNGVSSKY